MAEPLDEGYYLIKGQKIFISAGDHDGVENVVHLMLTKIKGAPAGVKGISLFIVPKRRIDTEGRLVSNDVVTSGVYHKLGYRGCPIVLLLEILTPVAKSYPSEMGILSVSQGLQCFGGSGYWDDYPLELISISTRGKCSLCDNYEGLFALYTLVKEK